MKYFDGEEANALSADVFPRLEVGDNVDAMWIPKNKRNDSNFNGKFWVGKVTATHYEDNPPTLDVLWDDGKEWKGKELLFNSVRRAPQ